jgi:two-component system, cell cycle sensor histidine kinase and response regulator CckA
MKDQQAKTQGKISQCSLPLRRPEWLDIFNAIGHPALILDPQHRIISANLKALELTGKPLCELIGKPCYQIFHGKDTTTPPLSCPLEIMFKSGHLETAEMEVEVTGRFFLVSCSPVFDDNGNIEKIIHIATDVTERRHALEELRESRHHASLLADLLERSSQPFMTHYPDGRMGICNNAFSQLLGYPKQELLTLDWAQDLTPPKWIEKERLLLEDLNQTGQPIRYKKEFIRKNGTLVPVELLVHLQKDDTGKPKYYYAFVTDITERKMAKDALRTAQNFSRALLENIIDGVVACDSEGKLVLFNRTAREWHGLDPLDISQEEWARSYNLYEADSITLMTSDTIALARAFKGEVVRDAPMVIRANDRPPRAILANAAPFFDTDGRLLGAVSVMRDVTEQKKSEKALVNAEKRFRDLLEHVQLAAVMLDLNGNIIFCNDYLLGMTGHARDDVLFRNWFDLFAPQESRKLMKAEFSANILQNTLPPHSESTLVTRDGSTRLVVWDNAVLHSPEGEMTGTASIGKDITEQQKLEEQLRQSQKLEALGQLAGGVAHDFNNILTAIVGYVHLSLMKTQDDEGLRNNLEMIIEAANKATALTQSLLSFSRKQIINPQPHSLNKIIKRLQTFLSRLIREDIAITTACGETDLMIFADSGQIEQILMNLVTNARDAMPHGGQITIRAEAVLLDEDFVTAHGYGTVGNYALLSVTDTGKGMDSSTKERIFEPFFTTKEQGKGTGLGLATVYGAVKQHNGYISVCSEVEKGTTFKIYLPLFKGFSGTERNGTECNSLPRGSETILIAEDNNELRELAHHILHKYGYTVIEAADGNDALAKYKDNKDRVQLLLLDAIMPKKNGKAAYREIQALNPSIKALFMSGYAEDIIMGEGMFEEGINFIIKPITPSGLLRKVREVLDS